LNQFSVRDDLASNTKMMIETQNEPTAFFGYTERLPKGIKKLSYQLIVTHAGTCSVPFTEIQAGKLLTRFAGNFLIRTANR